MIGSVKEENGERDRKDFWKYEEHMSEKPFIFIFFQYSIGRVPIEPGRSYSSEISKILTGWKLGSINQKTDSIDQVLIEHQSN